MVLNEKFKIKLLLIKYRNRLFFETTDEEKKRNSHKFGRMEYYIQWGQICLIPFILYKLMDNKKELFFNTKLFTEHS